MWLPSAPAGGEVSLHPVPRRLRWRDGGGQRRRWDWRELCAAGCPTYCQRGVLNGRLIVEELNPQEVRLARRQPHERRQRGLRNRRARGLAAARELLLVAEQLRRAAQQVVIQPQNRSAVGHGAVESVVGVPLGVGCRGGESAPPLDREELGAVPAAANDLLGACDLRRQATAASGHWLI